MWVIIYPSCVIFSREATSEIYGPGSIFYHIVFRSIIRKTQKYLAALFYLLILFRVLFRSIYPNPDNLIYLFTEEGLTTPLTRRVASICSLCVGTIYIVLLGSPTGLITLVS